MHPPAPLRQRETHDALEAFLSDAAWRGERSVAIARVSVMVLVLIQKVALDAAALLEGVLKEWIVTAGAVLACLFSIGALLGATPTRPGIRRRAVVSVIIDALVLAVLIAPAVIWPRPDYNGLLESFILASFMVTTVAGGMRLSKSVTVIAIAANLVVLCGLISLDLALNTSSSDLFDLVTLAILFTAASILAWVTTARTRHLVVEGASAMVRAERTRQRLGAYVSEALIGVAMDETSILDAGQRQSIAVLFSDLRGFTMYAEKLPPEQLVDELNAYLSDMVEVIRAEGGVVDKYIGDSIMAVFGVPQQHEEDAVRAIRTAAAMQSAMVAHNARRSARGLPPLAQGIGVHYGDAIAGNIGTPTRLQYTVIGDAVNLASRLESSTKTMGHPVLISGPAVAAAGGYKGPLTLPEVTGVGDLTVRGRQEAIDVFTLKEDPAHVQ